LYGRAKPRDAAALWEAETHMRKAALFRLSRNPVDLAPTEKSAVERLASQMWFNTIGGSSTIYAEPNFDSDADKSLLHEEHWQVLAPATANTDSYCSY
jgi:hypothetical protein